jgi:hypothetical protein
MRRFFSFWWMCAKRAFWGNTAFANDWQWVFGIPLVAGLTSWVASQRGSTEVSTGYPIADGFLAALGAFIVTWCVAFLIRIFNAPVEFYHELQVKLTASSSSHIETERKAFVERAFLSFGPVEIEWLDRMNISGRPVGCPDEVWQQLEQSGVVERDFAGPKGIKEELGVAVRQALAERLTLANSLQIIVGTGSKYRTVEQSGNTPTEMINVGLRNSHATHRLTNCKIFVKLPENVTKDLYLYESGITLEPQHERLIAVAYFRDFKIESSPPDRIGIPAKIGSVQLPIDPSFITLIAKATEAAERQIRCKIWLDEHRHLQLEEVHD